MTESGIPQPFRATMRYSRIHLDFLPRSATPIGQLSLYALSDSGALVQSSQHPFGAQHEPLVNHTESSHAPRTRIGIDGGERGGTKGNGGSDSPAIRARPSSPTHTPPRVRLGRSYTPHSVAILATDGAPILNLVLFKNLGSLEMPGKITYITLDYLYTKTYMVQNMPKSKIRKINNRASGKKIYEALSDGAICGRTLLVMYEQTTCMFDC